MAIEIRIFRAFAALVAVALGCLGAAPVLAACTVSAAVTTTTGPYSPAATRVSAVPAIRGRAGLDCTGTLLVILANNRIDAKFTSANNLKLKRVGGTETISYIASADPAQSVAFSQNGTINYMQNNLLNALGLLGSNTADLPIYVKPTGNVVAPPIGTYTDTITILWNWYICQGVGALGACAGTPDVGTNQSTTITITMTVAPQNVTLAVRQASTWDPTNGTDQPKALPGGKGRVTLEAHNPDIVALDTASVALVYPVPATLAVALDGDGASSGAAIILTDGSPASTLVLTYADPTSTTDDVDFSANHGASWTYSPVPGNPASQAAVTDVRLRPRGSMAKQSSFSISLPFIVR